MNKITIIDNLWAEVEALDNDVERLLRYRPPGYQFAPSYRAKRWDGWISLVRHRKHKTLIPAGLVPYVMTQPWAGTYQLEDLRQLPGVFKHYSEKQLIALDPHQEAAVSSAILAGQGIIQYPTGTGKARIIGEIVRRLQVPVLVLCDKRDLLHQLAKEIEACLGEPVGKIGDGLFDVKACTVATFQTVNKRLNSSIEDVLQGFQGVICDEAQHTAAKTFEEVLVKVPAFYRLAASATAFRSYSGKSGDRGTFLRVQAWTGPPVASLSISEGIDTGRIVAPDIFIVAGCKWEGKAINFKEEYQAGIVDNVARNSAIARLALRLSVKEPTVVLTSRIDHGSKLAFMTQSEFVHGGLATAQRLRLFDAFKQDQTRLLIISKIGDEGLDLPNIGNLILAGGGRAPHVQTQRIGRGMRASEGKDGVQVFDFVDYGKYIGSHYRRRRRGYDIEDAYNVYDLSLEDLTNLLTGND